MARGEQDRPDDAEFGALIAAAHRGIRREIRRGDRRRARRALTGGLVALVVAGGGAAVASGGPFPTIDAPGRDLTSAESSDHFGIPHGVTADGRTYGAAPWTGSSRGPASPGPATPPEDPDLIAVRGDHGIVGFVDSRELNRLPRDPCEEPKVWPVFAEDGVTRVDTFTSGSREGWTVTGTGTPACPDD